MKNVLRFWLERGVSGFRVDTVPHLFEVLPDASGRYPHEPKSGSTNDSMDYGYLSHIYTQSQDETYDMVYQWRELLDHYQRDNGGHTRVLMTEAYVEDVDLMMRFYDNGEGRLGAHIPMNFYIILNLDGDSDAADYKSTIDLWMTHMPKGQTANWVLGNHDKRRVASRFGPERVDIMNMIKMGLPGVSITYYGEEIGMRDVWISWEETVDPQACNTNRDVYEPHSRDPARTPFQWNNSTSAGFSTNSKTWLPVSPDYQLVNFELQERASQSHLKVFRELVKLRSQPAFQHGSLETFSLMDDEVLVMVRQFNEVTDSYVLVANVGKEQHQVDLGGMLNSSSLDGLMVYEVVDSSSKVEVGRVANQKAIIISPNETFVLRLVSSSNGLEISKVLYLSLCFIVIVIITL